MNTFKGLNHYSKGQATINAGEESLNISNFGESSLDGFSVNTNGSSTWELTFEDIELSEGINIGATYNMVDTVGRLKTLGQIAVCRIPGTEYAYICVNSKLEGDTISVRGEREGEVVFERSYDNPDSCEYNWIPIVLALVAIVNSVDYSKTTSETKDAEGQVISTTTTTTKSFGGSSMVGQPVGLPLSATEPVIDGENVDFDHVFISSGRSYGEGGEPEELRGPVTEVIITAKGIDQMILTNEEYVR